MLLRSGCMFFNVPQEFGCYGLDGLGRSDFGCSNEFFLLLYIAVKLYCLVFLEKVSAAGEAITCSAIDSTPAYPPFSAVFDVVHSSHFDPFLSLKPDPKPSHPWLVKIFPALGKS